MLPAVAPDRTRLAAKPFRGFADPNRLASLEALRGGRFLALHQPSGAPGLEGGADVLEEVQAEDDVVVVAGLHAAAQLVGGLERLRLDAEGPGLLGLGSHSTNRMT